MASDCYGITLTKKCHSDGGTFDAGAYLDFHGFSHSGWSASYCRQFATQHYEAGNCNKKDVVVGGVAPLGGFVKATGGGNDAKVRMMTMFTLVVGLSALAMSFLNKKK